VKNRFQSLPFKFNLQRYTEGQDMRELIQDRINEWFVENRDPATGVGLRTLESS
jgi:hypothetical protein